MTERIREYRILGWRNKRDRDGRTIGGYDGTVLADGRNEIGELRMAVEYFISLPQWDRITVELFDALHPDDAYGVVLRLDRKAEENWQSCEDKPRVEQPALFSETP